MSEELALQLIRVVEEASLASARTMGQRDQSGFGDDGTESGRPCQSGQGGDYMKEQDNDVAHSGYQHLKSIKLSPIANSP